MSGAGWRVLRTLLLPLVRMFYRLRVHGARNVPASGPGIILCNHVSFVDSILLGAALERPPRFLIWRRFYEHPLFGPLVRAFGALPIDRADSPQAMRRSIETVVAALKAGDLVILFPEGEMTRTAHVQGFKRGFEVIARRSGAPIIPAYLDGLWGSIFSFHGGKYIWKRPSSLSRPVAVVFGAAMPPEATRAQVRQAVMELGVEAFGMRKAHQLPLHAQFWRRARAMWRQPCMADSTGKELTWGRALAGSLTLARWIVRRCPEEKMIGMLMPASVGAALVNVATVMAGRVPVNLNFTGARGSIDVAIHRCKLKTLFTSRALLQRLEMPERPEYVYLEDLIGSIPRRDKVISFLLARLMPTCIAERHLLHPSHMDDLATVMFTSGSTGEPKGVMLSHHNVVSNIQAFSEVLRFGPADTMMGVLPPFHSFGFTTTVWTPLTLGMRVVYHPNPLDAKGVARMVEQYGATIIAGTSAFYALYARAIPPESFRSLRLAVAGGQKLVPAVAEAFAERFGIPLSEGYGCTELSPVVAVNSEDVRDGAVCQAGARVGSVGRLLPGMAVRVIDRETRQPLPEGASGIVLIKGPNVMQRYMDDARSTEAVVLDGWYLTADIGRVDDDGFLYIHDRISRFSKIGGEMVPHTAVEEALAAVAGVGDWRWAVITQPDRVRGEKLCVVWSGPDVDIPALLKKMAERGIPNLWLPAPRDFCRVESLPQLPTGKADLVAIRKMASP